MNKIFGMVGLLLLKSMAWAGPSHINFQGRLTDDDGQPRVGPTDVKFEVYDRETGGSPLWPLTPQDGDGIQPVTANASGLFSTIIGPFDPGFFSGNREYWLEISVKSFGFQVLKPRKQLTSVPFAFHSEKSNISLVADTVGFESIVSTSIVNGSIEGIDIKDRAIGSAKIQDNSIGNQHIRVSTITAEKLDLSSLQNENLRWVPVGGIIMFPGACPQGWIPFTSLHGRFPLGVGGILNKSPGDSMDVSSHTHNMGNHVHVSSGTVDEMYGEFDSSTAVGDSNTFDGYPVVSNPSNRTGLTGFMAGASHRHRYNGTTLGPSTADTLFGSHIPPFFALNFCQRQ